MKLTRFYVLVGLTHLFIIMIIVSSCNSIQEKQKSSLDSITVVKFNVLDTIPIIKHNDSSSSIIDSFPTHSTNKKLPFIGKRHFETRPGVSGTGTPQLSVEITPKGKVVFHYFQNNTGKEEDDPTKYTVAKYKAGKFKRILKCDFSKIWEGFQRYYIITTNYIYEVDSLGNRIYKNECCSNIRLSDESTKCYCEGELRMP